MSTKAKSETPFVAIRGGGSGNNGPAPDLEQRQLAGTNDAKAASWLTRLLFITTSLPGGDRPLFNILRHLDAERFHSSLFLLKPECVNWEEIAGCAELILGSDRIKRIRSGLPTILGRLLKAAARHDIMVGALELDSTYLAYFAGSLLRKPVIGWVQTTLDEYLKYKQRWHRPLLRAIYPKLDRVVFVNEQAAASLEKIVHLDASRVLVINNSLDPHAVEQRQQTAGSWKCPSLRQMIVMAVGRLNPEKGFDVLIRAHQRLRRSGLEHLLVILGKGPLEDELTDLAQRLGVADSVVMPGYFVNPYGAMKQATVFVLSSRVEGFPEVLLEALYLSVPIVATNCPSGPAEILDNGRYGLLVPPNDEIKLSEAIGALLTDADKRKRMSEAGRIRIRDFYTRNLVPRWQSMFADIIRSRAGTK